MKSAVATTACRQPLLLDPNQIRSDEASGSNLVATHRLDLLGDLVEQLARRGFRICGVRIGGQLLQTILARRKPGRTSAATVAAGLTHERQLDGRLAESVKSELGQPEKNSV